MLLRLVDVLEVGLADEQVAVPDGRVEQGVGARVARVEVDDGAKVDRVDAVCSGLAGELVVVQIGLVDGDEHATVDMVDLVDVKMSAEGHECARVDVVAVDGGVSVHVRTAQTSPQCDNHNNHTCAAACHTRLCAPQCDRRGHVHWWW